jgi:glutamate-ammonia-ligase adenylyltransferase
MKRRKAARQPPARRRSSSAADAGTNAPLVARFHGGLPIPSRAGAGAATAWLAAGKSEAKKTLRALTAQSPALGRILGGIAEAAPFLWALIEAAPERLVRLLESDPDRALSLLLARTRREVAKARAPDEAMRALRGMKAEAALLIALADIGGVWSVEEVTEALSAVADTAVGAAVNYLLTEAVSGRKLKAATAKDPGEASGYIVLAMGKMGGRELNYSSDIDLIVMFEATAPRLSDGVEPGQFYVGLTRALVRLLQERTPDGYVFRVDLRLRPDPASTQIAISTLAALDYYESRGQNWERAAMIKARACAGDIAAGDKVLRELSPIIWRKYLDYAAIADVHEMKRQIHAYRGHGEIAVEGHNIKLGRGGIREIEFFVQTQQLIAGGRHPELRGRQTVPMLGVLAADGWIDTQARDALREAYAFLRRVEHRLQMMDDAQTHTLPAGLEAMARFARFFGYADRDTFAQALLGHLQTVERHYIRLFERIPEGVAGRQSLPLAPANEREAIERLGAMGFRRPMDIIASLRDWQAGRYRALRGEQARDNLLALVTVLLDEFAKAEDPDAAFVAFDRFIGGLRAGGRFFSLLRRNPELIRFIALILAVAPRLADILARNPHFIDALIDPSFFGALPDEARLSAALTRALADTLDYEAALDAVRLFGQEHMFLIGARVLSGSVSAEQAGESFATLADVMLGAVHALVEKDFATTHGRIRGAETAIVALGRLGAREMTASSDLDLLLIYDFDEEHPSSDGRRPLYGAQYFARLTQRIISALTVQTNYGVLYHVDMRLRPSGRAGPVATRIEGFRGYHESEAWTWEHMALTRARVVSAKPAFARRIERIIHATLCRKRDAGRIAGDVVEMRRAIAKEKGESDPWDLKYVAGGLIDIEFIAQFLELAHAHAVPELLDRSTARVLEKALRLSLLPAKEADVLPPAVSLLQGLTQILRLCLAGPFDPKAASPGVLALLARAADLPDFAALEAHLKETERAVRATFLRIVGT